MPRYVVERDFTDGLQVPLDDAGASACMAIVETNGAGGVTWLHSYVTLDKHKTFCVYDGPTSDAVRLVAERNGLPVTAVTPVRVLDPYFYY